MRHDPLKIASRFFSIVFNPFLIPTYGFFLIYSYIPGTEFYSHKIRNILFLIYLISTCVLPIIFIAILYLNKAAKNYLDHHHDRIVPYLFTAFSVFMGSQLAGKLPVPGIFRVFLLGIAILIAVSIVISFRWKISGHVSSLGGLVGVMTALNFRYGMGFLGMIIVALIVSGFVGSSRIYLHKHTPAQVYSGFVLGLACMFLTVYFI